MRRTQNVDIGAGLVFGLTHEECVAEGIRLTLGDKHLLLVNCKKR